jgi:hypothetical protein
MTENLPPKCDVIFLIFDEFVEACVEKLKCKVEQIKACNSTCEIVLVGNDKLTLDLTGKEKQIRNFFAKEQLEIYIINFCFLKEINNLFFTIARKTIAERQL